MLQKYIKIPYEEIIEHNYYHLSNKREFGDSFMALPFIGDLTEEVYKEKMMDLRSEQIEDAIDRNEHYEIYNLCASEFRFLAYSNSLNEFEMPTLKVDSVQYAVYSFLNSRRMSYVDPYGELVNNPIKGDVW